MAGKSTRWRQKTALEGDLKNYKENERSKISDQVICYGHDCVSSGFELAGGHGHAYNPCSQDLNNSQSLWLGMELKIGKAPDFATGQNSGWTFLYLGWNCASRLGCRCIILKKDEMQPAAGSWIQYICPVWDSASGKKIASSTSRRR